MVYSNGGMCKESMISTTIFIGRARLNRNSSGWTDSIRSFTNVAEDSQRGETRTLDGPEKKMRKKKDEGSNGGK